MLKKKFVSALSSGLLLFNCYTGNLHAENIPVPQDLQRELETAVRDEIKDIAEELKFDAAFNMSFDGEFFYGNVVLLFEENNGRKPKINLNFEYNESGGEFHFELYPKNTGRVHYIAGDAFIRKNHDGKLNMQYGVKIKGSRRYLENMPLLMLRKKERQEFEKLTERARVPVDITIAPINRGFGDLAELCEKIDRTFGRKILDLEKIFLFPVETISYSVNKATSNVEVVYTGVYELNNGGSTNKKLEEVEKFVKDLYK